MAPTDFIFDADLLRRYDRSGPRYTSYPTAVEFDTDFSLDDYRQQTALVTSDTSKLSLYLHLPFCATVCYYCACNKIVTNNRSRAGPYLHRLHREIALQAACYPCAGKIHQLHWGGGTPTYLNEHQMRELMAITRQHFDLVDDAHGEYSIEIDPRETESNTMAVLREIGFNRLSVGVQDFDPKVQRAVNRMQSEACTLAVINDARDFGFRSINVDLIYGLPYQSCRSFKHTVERIIAADPDRISVFNYAHLPARFKVQRQIDERTLPSAGEKLSILQQTAEQLISAGYCYIGMDHFAKPDDELAIAQCRGELTRNFQGYSTHGDCHLIGLGVTGIGAFANCYYQNARDIERYNTAIDADRLPIERGRVLSKDDRIRRYVIGELICHFNVSFQKVNAHFGIDAAAYFACEIDRILPLQDDGLVQITRECIDVTPRGRLLIRNICMIFDRYLTGSSEDRFSKVL